MIVHAIGGLILLTLMIELSVTMPSSVQPASNRVVHYDRDFGGLHLSDLDQIVTRNSISTM
jgi:hypothetical protein